MRLWDQTCWSHVSGGLARLLGEMLMPGCCEESGSDGVQKEW